MTFPARARRPEFIISRARIDFRVVPDSVAASSNVSKVVGFVRIVLAGSVMVAPPGFSTRD
jgi:hypothetical protein